MDPKDCEFFAEHGYLELGKLLSDEEVQRYLELYELTVKPTGRERKTVQIYYGHRHRPYLSNQSIIPATLWRNYPDLEVRDFYGNLNDRTRIYMAAAGVEATPSFPMSGPNA